MTYSIHPNTVLGEVKLRVSDLERSILFYEQVVGLTLLSRTGEHVASFTAKGGSAPLLILEEIPNAKKVAPRSHAGLYHFAILLPDRTSLGIALRHLAESGIEIGQGDHTVSEALYINDPDGHGIEIYADRPRSTWKKDEHNNYIMGTDPVDVQGLLQLAGVTPFTGLPAGTIIGHVHFHTSDLEEARHFYNHLLGFDIVVDASRYMHALFASAGGYHHHIGLNVWAGKGAPKVPSDAVGIDYFTIIFENQAVYEEALVRLEQNGVSVSRKAEEARVMDPFGIQIRITHA